MEYTLSIIKPDATRRNLQGKILAMIQEAGLQIVAQKYIKLSLEKAKQFYITHKDRSFYEELCNDMIQFPISVQILKGENAIAKYRDLMGATNPNDAAPGTIRKLYAESIGHNSVHGSDSKENAEYEINLMFSKDEIFG